MSSGQYLIVEDAELEAIEIESTHTIEIDRFVPHSARVASHIPRSISSSEKNHGLRFEGILKIDLQGNRLPKAKTGKFDYLSGPNHPAHSIAFKFFTDDNNIRNGTASHSTVLLLGDAAPRRSSH